MALRSAIGSIRSHGDYDREPDVANFMLHLIIYALLLLYMIAYPFKAYTAWTSCVQVWSMVSAFLFFFTYHGLLTMQSILEKSPYELDGDCVNVDSHLVSSEQSLFQVIRARYWKMNTNQESGTFLLDDSPVLCQ